MHYDDGAFYRPLFENNMLQLQVAHGCSHNRCKFCDMYHEPFAISPREEVLADLDEAADYFGEAGCETIERVFLTGGNAFCLPQRELVFVLEAIAERFPRASVGCFARVTDIARKGDDDLAELARRRYLDRHRERSRRGARHNGQGLFGGRVARAVPSPR